MTYIHTFKEFMCASEHVYYIFLQLPQYLMTIFYWQSHILQEINNQIF